MTCSCLSFSSDPFRDTRSHDSLCFSCQTLEDDPCSSMAYEVVWQLSQLGHVQHLEEACSRPVSLSSRNTGSSPARWPCRSFGSECPKRRSFTSTATFGIKNRMCQLALFLKKAEGLVSAHLWMPLIPAAPDSARMVFVCEGK